MIRAQRCVELFEKWPSAAEFIAQIEATGCQVHQLSRDAFSISRSAKEQTLVATVALAFNRLPVTSLVLTATSFAGHTQEFPLNVGAEAIVQYVFASIARLYVIERVDRPDAPITAPKSFAGILQHAGQWGHGIRDEVASLEPEQSTSPQGSLVIRRIQ